MLLKMQVLLPTDLILDFHILFVQAMYVLFRADNALKLPYCIAIAGFVCALFAFGIPHLSALRIWLGISTFLSLIYIIVAFVLSLSDGTESFLRV